MTSTADWLVVAGFLLCVLGVALRVVIMMRSSDAIPANAAPWQDGTCCAPIDGSNQKADYRWQCGYRSPPALFCSSRACFWNFAKVFVTAATKPQCLLSPAATALASPCPEASLRRSPSNHQPVLRATLGASGIDQSPANLHLSR